MVVTVAFTPVFASSTERGRANFGVSYSTNGRGGGRRLDDGCASAVAEETEVSSEGEGAIEAD
jgi:hypothetical protein